MYARLLREYESGLDADTGEVFETVTDRAGFTAILKTGRGIKLWIVASVGIVPIMRRSPDQTAVGGRQRGSGAE